MKRFGFHPDQLYFNIYNSKKVRYLQNTKLGKFEAPKNSASSTNMNELHANYQKRLEWEKYMNPKGLKPTITSHFQKPPQEQEFVNHEVLLMRSPKKIDNDWASFRMSPYLSKPEIKQYLMKLYNLNVQAINTVNVQGKIMRRG